MIDVRLLSSADMFKGFDDDALQQLITQATIRSLLRGDVLFNENDAAEALFIVESGRVAISNKSFDGRESMVALMEPGDLFGEMGLFDERGRSAEARILEQAEIIEIPYVPIAALYESKPQLLRGVVEMLVRRLRSMDVALADSVFLDVTGRTAKRLLEIAGENDDFELPVTQEELAGMVGASRERVNKSIAQFVKLGWLEQRPRGYRITNREQLEIRSM